MRLHPLIPASFLAAGLSTSLFAQDLSAPAQFGGLRVPACSIAADADYGHVAAKPIQLGGGPSNASARMARYIGALRGPQGQALQLSPTRGSLLAPLGYWNEPTFIDAYTVLFDGQSMPLYVDSYHFSLPQAPAGLTCGGPLVTALGMPPLDPMKANSNLVALAIEQGSSKEIPAVALDTATPRGYLMDQFTMIARRARAASVAGMPLDPNRPPADIEPGGLSVLVQPVACGARTIVPQSVELLVDQMPIPRIGDIIRGDAVAGRFSGVPTPAGSIAARFRPSRVTQVKISYAEQCDGGPSDVLLSLNVEPPRLVARPGTLPGISEPDPTVYLQVILDTEGRFARPLHIGGPKSLLPAALETIRGWTSTPLRLNGVPNVNPVILQVIFR